MNMKKRLLAILLTGVISLSLMACGDSKVSQGSTSSKTDVSTNSGQENKEEGTPKKPEDFKKFKIGVLEAQAIDEVVIRRDYYENYIGPKYNVEFIFSEQCKDTDAEIRFIENCADLGADAIISYRTEDANQMVQICQEYGMVYTINGQRVPGVEEAFAGGYENFTGGFGADQPNVGSLFKNWLINNASEDGKEGFLVTSSLSFRGNRQHLECTVAVLTALQEKYNLTYEDSIENIAVTSAPIEVANDKNIKIYVYPGTVSTNEGWLQGVSAALQTGKYGVFIHSGQTYSNTAVVVDEVEKAFNMDIKVASVASMSAALMNAFETKDAFGNASVNMATVKSTSIASSMGFVQAYNALTGYSHFNRQANGEPAELLFRMWDIDTVEAMREISSWDIAGGDKWIFDNSSIDKVLGIYNPDLTFETIQNIYNDITFEEAKVRLGTK